ncbi:recombinase family protein [Dermabacter vaginalis]|uniref:recombinase family protein n=1 Tax=Dermabacter vaginalis TaxID=1630135 RepID=UPI0035CD0E73
MRDIEIDPDRADLIRFAFTAYATSYWSLSKLTKALETRGLTTREMPTHASRPVTTTGLHKILTNPLLAGHSHLPRSHLRRRTRHWSIRKPG